MIKKTEKPLVNEDDTELFSSITYDFSSKKKIDIDNFVNAITGDKINISRESVKTKEFLESVLENGINNIEYDLELNLESIFIEIEKLALENKIDRNGLLYLTIRKLIQKKRESEILKLKTLSKKLWLAHKSVNDLLLQTNTTVNIG